MSPPAEKARPRPARTAAPIRSLRVDGLDGVEQAVQDLVVDGVELVGSVERDDRDVTRGHDFDDGHCARSSPYVRTTRRVLPSLAMVPGSTRVTAALKLRSAWIRAATSRVNAAWSTAGTSRATSTVSGTG